MTTSIRSAFRRMGKEYGVANPSATAGGQPSPDPWGPPPSAPNGATAQQRRAERNPLANAPGFYDKRYAGKYRASSDNYYPPQGYSQPAPDPQGSGQQAYGPQGQPGYWHPGSGQAPGAAAGPQSYYQPTQTPSPYGQAWAGGPGDPMASRMGLTVPRFRSVAAFDKLIGLVMIAIVAAAVGYAVVPVGFAFVSLLVAFAVVAVSWFRMRWAKFLAPAYAVFEGVALGGISREFASVSHGIVPAAIVFTAAVFVACLVLYRTGLVRVTPRMVSLAFMGGLGIMAVAALSLLGLSLPGLNGVGPIGLIFGVIILAVAILNLFTDFAYVTQAERVGLPAEAEWAAAFAMMTALVLVYISMLRILLVMFGGGGRRG